MLPVFLSATDNPVQALFDARVVRWFSAAGLAMLVYDHILTLKDEIKLVWFAPKSFAKFAFILNRYLVLASLLTVAAEMCGFVGDVFSDAVSICKNILIASSMLAVCSISIANALILLRVFILWQYSPVVLKLMTLGFILTFSAQTVTMAFALKDLTPGVTWSSTAGMCVAAPTTATRHLLTGVWASPMVFELLVLFTTVINALHRPREAELPLARALYRDGAASFLALVFLRVLNFALTALVRPSLTLMGSYFVWALITVILNRSLLRLRQAELEDKVSRVLSGRMSPFGIRSDSDVDDVYVDMKLSRENNC